MAPCGGYATGLAPASASERNRWRTCVASRISRGCDQVMSVIRLSGYEVMRTTGYECAYRVRLHVFCLSLSMSLSLHVSVSEQVMSVIRV